MGLLSVTSESMYTKYWITAKVKPAQEKVWLYVTVMMIIAVDCDVKHQTKTMGPTKNE